MKKRTVAACALAAVLSFALLAGCGTGTNNLSGEETKSSVTELSALEGYTVTGIDRLGVVSASRTDADTEYVLYSTENGGIMASSPTAFTQVAAGLYVSSAEQSDGTVYTVYGKDGQAASQTVASGELDPVFSTSNGTVTFPNGDVLYVGVDGEVHTAAITALTPYARYGRVTRLGDDCYVESVGEGLNVFDKNGKYLRTVSAGSLFDIPADAAQADTAVWAVGVRVFMQYAYAVPDDSRDYDFYDAGTKYCLETAWYDIASDSEGTADMAYVVNANNAAAFSNDACAVLYVNKILDNKQLSSRRIIQAFNNGGGIHLDLQALLPGADDIEIDGKSVLLSDGAVENYYYDNRLVYSLPAYKSTTPMQNYFVADNSIYSAADKAEFTLSETQSFLTVTGGNAYYMTVSDGQSTLSVWGDGGSRTLGTLLGRGTDWVLTGDSLSSCALYDLSAEGGLRIFSGGVLDSASVNIRSSSGGTVAFYVYTVSSGGTARHWLRTDRAAG